MTRKSILVVDDEAGTRESLRAIFTNSYRVLLAEGAEHALATLRAEPVDLILLDILMPRHDGLGLLKQAMAIYPNIPVIMVTASSADESVITAMRLGAHDYILKPFDITDLRQTVARALETRTLSRRVEALEDRVTREYPIHGIIGMSSSFRRSVGEAMRLANEPGPALIQGETGTGKELFARLVHASSDRRDEPFVAVRRSDAPDAKLSSLLFGEERDPASRGARLQPGSLDIAGTGTLFFSDIGNATPEFQKTLAKVSTAGEFRRIGGHTPIQTNCRLIFALRTPFGEPADSAQLDPALAECARNQIVQIPPLRERQEDIPLLAHYFLNLLRLPDRESARDFEPKAMDLLRRYAWPGNVRELRNVVERLLVVHGSNATIEASFLPREFHPGQAAQPLPGGSVRFSDAVHACERQLIESALRQANGVQSRAAEILGTTRRILKYRMERLKIDASTAKS